MFDSQTLGARYDSLDEAKEYRKDNEVIVTDNHDVFYCVTMDVYNNGPRQLGYVIIKLGA